MLILQRREGESLLIGDSISVTVVSIEGSRVRLAVAAPGEIPILRGELAAATQANQDSAHEEAAPAELIGLLGDVFEHRETPEEGKKDGN